MGWSSDLSNSLDILHFKTERTMVSLNDILILLQEFLTHSVIQTYFVRCWQLALNKQIDIFLKLFLKLSCNVTFKRFTYTHNSRLYSTCRARRNIKKSSIFLLYGKFDRLSQFMSCGHQQQNLSRRFRGFRIKQNIFPLLTNQFNHNFFVTSDILLEFHNNLLIPTTLLLYLDALTLYSKNQMWW